MKLWHIVTGYGALGVLAIVANLALLVLAVWLVVKVLQWMGVL